jgi:DNA-directed RNA polymerase subunit L
MGSISFEGVRFAAYSDDHPPPHVHGFYAGIEAIVELMIEERKVRLANRRDCVDPRNAKRSDVNHILRTAAKHFDELVELWETA